MVMVTAFLRFGGLLLCALSAFTMIHGNDDLPGGLAILHLADVLFDHPGRSFVMGSFMVIASIFSRADRGK